MGVAKQAITRMKQRSKLPPGDTIVVRECAECRTPIWLWNSAPELTPYYPYTLRCSYCKQAARALNAAIFGKS